MSAASAGFGSGLCASFRGVAFAVAVSAVHVAVVGLVAAVAVVVVAAAEAAASLFTTDVQ